MEVEGWAVPRGENREHHLDRFCLDRNKVPWCWDVAFWVTRVWRADEMLLRGGIVTWYW